MLLPLTSRSEQRFEMVPRHECLVVQDFATLYETIDSSIQILKQLGQSRYSSEMKDSLLYWCNVVERAKRWVLGTKTDLIVVGLA